MTPANVLKVCNCCLERNQRPVFMGVRAKVRYCRSCHMDTVWSLASPAQIAERTARTAFLQALIDAEA